MFCCLLDFTGIFHCMTFWVVNRWRFVLSASVCLDKRLQQQIFHISEHILLFYNLLAFSLCVVLCRVWYLIKWRCKMGAFPLFNSGCITHSQRTIHNTMQNAKCRMQHRIFINNSKTPVCLLQSLYNLHSMCGESMCCVLCVQHVEFRA